MRWDEDTIINVKEANDVVEVIGQQVPLKRAGSSFKGLCPFHTEKTPSFMVNPSKQIFHCFGCDTGGDVIRFVMLYDGLPFVDAVSKLADRVGIQLPQKEFTQGPGRDKKDEMMRANRIASDHFTDNLMRSPEGEKAREYLKARGIHSEVCKAYGIGYARPGWRDLAGKLNEEAVSLDRATAAGLLVEGTGGKKPYDRFRDRVIFPIRDITGRVLGFGGRVLDEELPKYINTPETPVYRKGDSLFGMDIAAPAIREAGHAVLVEGYLDVIALHQGDFRNVVGVLGTALTKEQARRIKRLSTDCVILFDSDDAGIKAALRSGLIMLEEGFRCRIASLRPGEDPDTALHKDGPESLKKLIEESVPVINYVMEEALKKHPGGKIRDKFQVIDAILPYLAKIEDRVQLGIYLKEIGDQLRIEQHDLRAKLASEKSRQKPEKEDTHTGEPLQKRDSLLLHIMVRDPKTIPRVKEYLQSDDFSGQGTPELVEKIFSGVNVSTLVDMVDENMKNTISRWALEDPAEGTGQALEDCLLQFVKNKLEKRIQKTSEKLTEAVEQGDDKTSQELNREWKQLQADLRDLKSGGGLPSVNM